MKTDDNRAVFSPCKRYRYVLRRKLPRSGKWALWIMLNPSVADETNNDPTTRRALNFTTGWGFGHYTACNLHAYRATDPQELKLVDSPTGPKNDWHLMREIARADQVIVAWGAWGPLFGREEVVRKMLPSNTWCLGFTKHWQPRFPLYLSAQTRPMPFFGDDVDVL